MAKEKKIIELVVESAKAITGIGNTSKAMKGLGESSKNASKGIKGIGIAWKAAGFGALLGLLSMVFEAFKRNQIMTDLVARGFDLIQKAVNVVVKVFVGALKVVDALTMGMFNLAGASDSASASLQRQRNEVRLLEAEEQLVQLQFQKRAEEQRQIRDDESKTLEERQNANEKLGKILDEQHKEELRRANKILKTRENELKADENNIELQERVIQAKTKVAEVDERITGQRSEMLVNINSLNRENKELAKTSGGVASAVKEEAKSYEDLNKEMKTALGLDQTVEGITQKIANAHKIRKEEIEKEKEELKELEESEKSYRKTSTKGLKELKLQAVTLRQERFAEELLFDQMHAQGATQFQLDIQESIINGIIEEQRLNEQAQLEEEKRIKNKNASNIRSTNAHNKEVERQIAEHNQKMLDSEKAFNQLIEDARQMARDELDYFLGTEEERELADLQVQFDKRMAMLVGDFQSQLRLMTWFEQSKKDIGIKFDEEEKDRKKASDQVLIDLETQRIEKSFSIASSFASSLGKLAGDNVKAQKNAAMLGITIDTAAAVSSVIRNAIPEGGGNPVLTPLIIAELLAIVFGGMAQAKGILSSVPGGSDSGANLQGLQAGIGVGGGDVPRS
jgi:myosin heavy subunit